MIIWFIVAFMRCFIYLSYVLIHDYVCCIVVVWEELEWCSDVGWWAHGVGRLHVFFEVKLRFFWAYHSKAWDLPGISIRMVSPFERWGKSVKLQRGILSSDRPFEHCWPWGVTVRTPVQTVRCVFVQEFWAHFGDFTLISCLYHSCTTSYPHFRLGKF